MWEEVLEEVVYGRRWWRRLCMGGGGGGGVWRMWCMEKVVEEAVHEVTAYMVHTAIRKTGLNSRDRERVLPVKCGWAGPRVGAPPSSRS